ncbi:hypothetical protein OS175_09740 [Marinicella sp. S1101]|uniref:hypothetical protein n=1 Tax=Marinicella marina TaxID=2996016 RepID=UPI002260A5E0|nr:hypothetical protein [Marinicella marina]MCX7554159.1 hypothetical protein [Marinicella marina]MDJ1141148.1 hypothetical protein [Marinicella marina]
MFNSKKIMIQSFLILSLLVTFSSQAELAKQVDGVTTIHLDQYGGYFETKETLAGLKAGTYEFVITNKTNKLVGFHLQNNKTREELDRFPLEPNQTRISRVEITSDGFRFRCPINPTPWYEIDGVK